MLSLFYLKIKHFIQKRDDRIGFLPIISSYLHNKKRKCCLFKKSMVY